MLSRLRPYAVGLLVWAFVSAAPSGQTRPPQVQSVGITIEGSVVDPSLAVLPGVTVTLERDGNVVATTSTGTDGKYRFTAVTPGPYTVRARLTGFKVLTRVLTIHDQPAVVQLPLVMAIGQASEEMTVTAATPAVDTKKTTTGAGAGRGGSASGQQVGLSVYGSSANVQWNLQGRSITDLSSNSSPSYFNFDSFEQMPYPGESYARLESNRFRLTSKQPVSTFGADVDTASFTNVRRFLTSGQLPPRDAVRVEELVNYFQFAYPAPRGDKPIAITTEVGDCPWAPSHKLVLVGARAARAPGSRDGSTQPRAAHRRLGLDADAPSELPLIKTALGMFVDTLRDDDRLSIVTYAGTSGVALPPTPARERRADSSRHRRALLPAARPTAARASILAYRIARQAFIPGGVNRVILATDGDFNVGITSQRDLLHLIDARRSPASSCRCSASAPAISRTRRWRCWPTRERTLRVSRLVAGGAPRAHPRGRRDARDRREGREVPGRVQPGDRRGVEADRLREPRAGARRTSTTTARTAGEMGAGHTVTVLYEDGAARCAQPIDAETRDRPRSIR